MDSTMPVPSADGTAKRLEHSELHETLAKLGLTALPHECAVIACPGAYRWRAYGELTEGARHVLNCGQLPPELQAILKAALFKLESVASAERGSSRANQDSAFPH